MALALIGSRILVFNPAYAQVRNEHVWGVAWADIMKGGMTPQAAADKAFKRVEAIFAKYPIAQACGRSTAIRPISAPPAIRSDRNYLS